MNTSGINCRFALYSLVVGTLGSVAIHHWMNACFSSEELRTIAGTAAQISATMMGFLLAALAILASIANMRLLRNMQRTGHYQVLLGRMLVSAAMFFLLLIFSMSVLVVPDSIPHVIEFGGGLMIGSCYALTDAIWKFSAVLFSLKPNGTSLE